MQISLEEAIKAVVAYRRDRAKEALPLEPVPEPVQVSEEADRQLAQQIARELANMPDIREERVEELKQLFESGTYTVSAEMVTSAIIRRTLADRIR
jgi:flagellar biosynthesis anti-sigma factor FlgM